MIAQHPATTAATKTKTASLTGGVAASGLVALGFGMAAVLVTAAVGTLGQAGPPRPEGAELTLVAPQDQDAALQTIASDQRAQVAQDLAGCKIGLTRMSVGPMPGATA